MGWALYKRKMRAVLMQHDVLDVIDEEPARPAVTKDGSATSAMKGGDGSDGEEATQGV